MGKHIVDEVMRFSIIVNGNSAQKELYDLEKSTRNLTQRNKELRTEQARLIGQGQKQSAAYKAVTAEIKKNNLAVKTNKLRMKELQAEIGITGLTMAQLGKKATQLKLQLRNMIPGSAQYKRFNKDLKVVNAQLSKLRLQSKASQFSLGGIANGFNKYAALGASFIATLTGVVFSIQKLIDYNGKLSDAQSDVQKTTGLTKKEVDELTISFGLLQTRTNRIDLLKIAEEGGRIGILKDEIGDFVTIMNKAVVALGDSFPGGAEETASKLGKLKLLFKETKDQRVDKAYNAIGSAINELGANGVATEINIANFATRVGALPDALKPSIADALALGAGFEESGIQAEIAGRAYSILLIQAAKESEKFAKVMGITNDEVKELINDDPLEFMIKFAKGLKGMSATDTAKTLQFLGVSATGTNKILGALSNNTDRFIDLLDLSNRSMKEGTSLINEYNIKNTNFAAILDKIGKRMRGFLVNGPLVRGLKSMVIGFGKLIGVVKDANKAFGEESKSIFESAKANRVLASSSQKLLKEYEDLYKDGITPTADEKLRLDGITLQLQSSLGDSVVAINKETGALKLNTEAVRQQIKLKRLASDDEAATLASRLQGAVDEKLRLEKLLPESENQANAASDASGRAQRNFQSNNKEGSFYDDETRAVVQLSVKKRSELFQLNKKIEAQEERRIDLLEKLKELNFNETDVAALFDVSAPESVDTSAGGGVDVDSTFNVPTGDGGKSKQKKHQKSLLDFQRETQDAQLELMSEGTEKELEQQRIAHERKVQDLQSQKVTEGKKVTEINAEINRQLQVQDEINTFKVGAIVEKGLGERFTNLQEEYEKEKSRAQSRHNQELVALGDNEKAKEALDLKFKAEQLQRDEQHLQTLLKKLEEFKNSGYFSGINLELLTPEQVKVFEDLADELILKLTEVGVAKSALTGSDASESAEGAKDQVTGAGGGVDIFGFTAEQWFEAFDHLETTEEKVLAIQTAVMGLADVHAQYASVFQKMNENEFRKFEQIQDKKRNKLNRDYDAGLIGKKQYDVTVRALDEETSRKKAELDYQQAKNDKVQGISNAIIGTSVAIMQAYAQLGPIGGTIAAVLIGTLGALQINAIRKTPLPARGFEQGYYGNMPVRRDQDGKVFNASYGGNASTQLVNEPKYFLAGEGGKNFPEMIIDGKSFKQFRPDFKNALYREIARVKGYESGYYQNQSAAAPKFEAEDSTQMALIAMIGENNALLRDLRDNGIEAFLSRNMQNAKAFRDDIKQYEKLRNKNKI